MAVRGVAQTEIKVEDKAVDQNSITAIQYPLFIHISIPLNKSLQNFILSFKMGLTSW